MGPHISGCLWWDPENQSNFNQCPILHPTHKKNEIILIITFNLVSRDTRKVSKMMPAIQTCFWMLQITENMCHRASVHEVALLPRSATGYTSPESPEKWQSHFSVLQESQWNWLLWRGTAIQNLKIHTFLQRNRKKKLKNLDYFYKLFGWASRRHCNATITPPMPQGSEKSPKSSLWLPSGMTFGFNSIRLQYLHLTKTLLLTVFSA